MPPQQESDSLLHRKASYQKQQQNGHLSLQEEDHEHDKSAFPFSRKQIVLSAAATGATLLVMLSLFLNRNSGNSNSNNGLLRHTTNLTGPYHLLEVHHGQSFFDYYDFHDGPDSLGSAGYNTYVRQERAQELGLMDIVNDDDDGEEYVVMKSAAGQTRDEHGNRFRESIRLEGKRRLDRGLLVMDVKHMPAGCGVWPAFWTTDETKWPDHGEIDILEGINNQDVVKTALHTSQNCDMYAHVPRWSWSGEWDTATGLPDTFTGQLNFDNNVQADNCWVLAPHQWANQGCVAVSQENGTIGTAMNDIGGGAYVLEWDPASGYIRSWVFKNGHLPKNLLHSMQSADESQGSKTDDTVVVAPDPSMWGLPYAYFAIGDGTGCSADHFVNHHIVINLAFCGTVAGNRFQHDCPALYEQYNVHNDSVLTCNAYIDSNPKALEEAYWKIRGVYVYQRG
jgi:Glycosyl hydrolases family 16